MVRTVLNYLMCLRGKANFRNRSRYSDYHEKTYSRWFRRDFDFVEFNRLSLAPISHSGNTLVRYSNDHPNVQGQHAYGMASVMYDVLNRIALDSQLGHARAYEIDLAHSHLAYTQEQDLIVCDRHYPSYLWLATLHQTNRNDLIRCSAASFAKARRMLKGEGDESQIVTLKPPHRQVKEIKRKGLPPSITVRFVRVLLKTGEYEVLVTR